MGLLGHIQNWKNSYLKYRIIDFYPSHNIEQINIGFGKRIKNEEIEKILELLELSFKLLKSVFPGKYKDLLKDVKKIYIERNIIDDGDVSGMFIPNIKSISLPIKLFQSNLRFENKTEFIASIILHEAQHARLYRLGFDSNRKTLGRQERVCYSLQNRFGEKITNGSEIIRYCNFALSVDLENHYSTESFIIRQIENLNSKEVPNWIKTYCTRKLLKGYKKMKNIKNDNDIPEDLKRWILK